MTGALDKLHALLGEVTDLRHASALLAWDERVNMPPGGVPAHAEMLATIRRLAHEKFTSPEIGQLLEKGADEVRGLPPDSERVRVFEVAARDYRKAARVPPDYVAEHARVAAAAHQAWREARSSGDFELFRPHLDAIIRLKREYVGFFAPLDHPYDALLDDYEQGMRTSEVLGMFEALRPRQVELVRRIGSRPPIDTGFLNASYPERDMLGFASEVISTFGFDSSRGRQDKSAHPFAIAIGSDDVRITTRYDERHPFETLFSMMHEAGHALYEQGVSPAWNRSVVRGGASLGVHESQSRLWENLVGRSRPFWQHFFPAFKARFAAQLAGVSLDDFYRGINAVRPSLIRVEADEVTYNLHVMLRVEIEIELLTGGIDTRHIVDAWNARISDYLGVHVDEMANGVLQDMHWSVGLFGYFATYTIGNLLSVQLWKRFEAEHPGWPEHAARGEFAALRTWLQREIHQHGRSYLPADLVRRVTGTALDAGPYIDYLESKYEELYALA